MKKKTALQELEFKAVRSGGAGGQHVNKVSTKIELSFDVENSQALSRNQKERLYRQLGTRLTKDHVLHLACEETRSQHRNKDLVIKRFFETMRAELRVPKVRQRTKPKRSAIEKRLKSKKRNAEKKARRQKPKRE
ncbi:alternative ribosome rescue aminoacyl-tRNA hydrolase ArfB [Pricia sp. S334]|uniref:Alternative ribosome rescue aminoacyl-tRNA hydrolase ArfB n=1 Tax=Pricia mediterranea TaxID=3076079 RepID=A0ABU3L6A7_9FLAO|nr:alternative ribosome rescue aminoacyl-tRNA hydrolase ArfB [Pricia sp. S334]MDT7828744.1 alternative ribosome rescue aminoacyl-tRNA hydrolase ArfB [Pricia sp. S334]